MFFQINGHECQIHIATNGFTYQPDLAIDHKSLRTGDIVGSPIRLVKMPGWAWLFIAGAFVSSVLGSVFATVLFDRQSPITAGFLVVGMWLVVGQSKRQGLTATERAARCAGIVTVLFIAVFLMNWLIGSPRGSA